MGVLSVRLDDELESKLDFLMKKLKIVDKSTYIRQLLDNSLSEEMIKILCKQVEEKKISAWKAAEIADISLRKMLHELKKRKSSGYDEQSLREDLEFALK
jgi:predicted HTH domain antitoxin